MIIYVLARLVAVLEKGNVNDVLVDAETYASQSHESAPHTSDNASDGGDDRAEQKKAAEAELADTIDRLYKLYPTKTLRDGIHRTYIEICNFSINEVVVRSINTTITTLVPELAMYFFGGATLKDFAFAMILGELLGTYSSYAVATPLLAIWKTREPRWAKLEARYGEGASVTTVTES